MQILTGHTSIDTALVQPDYPYSFTLRCQRRVWLEHKARHGFRMVTQTSNPKRTRWVACSECVHGYQTVNNQQILCDNCHGGQVEVLTWNKPKAGTYHDLAVLVLADNGHVEMHAYHVTQGLATLEAFVTAYADGLQGELEQRIISSIRKAHERYAAIVNQRKATAAGNPA